MREEVSGREKEIRPIINTTSRAIFYHLKEEEPGRAMDS